MENLKEFEYKLIIKDFDEPSDDMLLDMINDIHELLACHSVELNKEVHND